MTKQPFNNSFIHYSYINYLIISTTAKIIVDRPLILKGLPNTPQPFGLPQQPAVVFNRAPVNTGWLLNHLPLAENNIHYAAIVALARGL